MFSRHNILSKRLASLSRKKLLPPGRCSISTGGAEGECSAPFVAASVVQVTLMNFQGQQMTIQGRTGQTLFQATQNDPTIPSWIKDDSNGGGATYSVVRNEDFTEDLFGEGASSALSHVIIANEWQDRMAPMNEREEHILSHYLPPEDYSSHSRLATEIILTKELDGLVVAVPEAPPIEDVE